MKPKVVVMMLNWNGLKDTIECLESLQKITYPNYEVVVVDNGSNGNDADVLEKKFGDYICLIRKDKNYGAGGGINIIMKHFLGDSDVGYLLMLDNDIVVTPEFLDELVGVFEIDPSIGMASAMVYHYDDPERWHSIRDKLNLWWLDYFLTLGMIIDVVRERVFGGKKTYVGNGLVKEVEHLGFWCTLFKRECVGNVGLLDEGCGGFESSDYFIRAKDIGYKAVYATKSKVWHKFRSGGRINGDWQYYGSSGLFRFMKKHSSRWQYFWFLIHFFGLHIWLATAYYLVWHRSPKVLLSFYRGTRDGLFSKWRGKSG